jgi:hypothetical protein
VPPAPAAVRPPLPAAHQTSGYAFVWAPPQAVWRHADEYQARAYTYNSAGGRNTVYRTSTGSYVVVIAGLGLVAGVAHATAYGHTNHFCMLREIATSDTAAYLLVRCYTADGIPADTAFTASYADLVAAPGKRLAYLRTYPPNSPRARSLVAANSFSSVGGTVSARRAGTGRYSVRLAGLRTTSGHVQVTATGADPVRCKAMGWASVAADQLVDVQCSSPLGAPRDAVFSLTYAQSTGILGAFPAAYASIRPSAPAHSPRLANEFSSVGGGMRTRRDGIGSYQVQLDRMPLMDGNAQVTAYGPGPGYCNVQRWNPEDGISVECFDTTGTPADLAFGVAFVA